ncbi:hypothetical protein CHUAL_001294 [Chamberlinius hualienensis]
MVNKEKCVKYAVLTFAILGILGGIALVGVGAIFLSTAEDTGSLVVGASEKMKPPNRDEGLYSNLNRDEQKSVVKFAVKVAGIVFIVMGLVLVIDGIIAIVGTIKEIRALLIIHLVLLMLHYVAVIYNIATDFSVQALAVGVVCSTRIALVATYVNMLKKAQLAERANTMAANQYRVETKI